MADSGQTVPLQRAPVSADTLPVLAVTQLPQRRRSPQLGQPQLGQPQLVQPQLAQPQLGQPQLGQPQLVQPQLAQPQLGQLQFAQPQLAQPQLGQPQLVQPQLKQSQLGQPQLARPPVVWASRLTVAVDKPGLPGGVVGMIPTQLWLAPVGQLAPERRAQRSWWARLGSLLGFAAPVRPGSPDRHPGYHRQEFTRR